MPEIPVLAVRMNEFRLIVISPPGMLPEEQSIVRQLFRAGLSRFHLRKPGSDRAALLHYLSAFSKEDRKKIRVHSKDRALLREGIAGLHLPFFSCHARKGEGVEILSGAEASFGCSTSIHCWEEYEKLDPALEYVFISPVFDSISKTGYQAVPALRELPPVQRLPLIALGGVRPGSIKELIRAGFAGAALLGALWERPLHAVETFCAAGRESSVHRGFLQPQENLGKALKNKEP